MNKITSYVGFAIKARKVLIGQSLIKGNKTKQIFCLLLCSSASENLINLANNVANKQNCELITINNLEEITHISGLKILAITDESLGNAIIKNKENVNLG